MPLAGADSPRKGKERALLAYFTMPSIGGDSGELFATVTTIFTTSSITVTTT